MQASAKTIAALLGGTVEGDPEVVVSAPAKIEEAQPGTLTFLANPKYEPYAYTTQASILLVSTDFEAQQPVTPTLVRVENVYAALQTLLQHFEQAQAQQRSSQAQGGSTNGIHSSATLGEGTTVGDFAVVKAGAELGRHCRIHDQVYIGEGVRLGDHVTVMPGARILHDCVVGDHSVIYANVVIGGDGFGFAPQGDGTYAKVPQLGNVVIGSHVEIGANTTIDRATMGSTRIADGVKIDNLCMIAHNVTIGANTVIAAQTGVAGSTHIGANCRIGGQVGFVGHIKIADGTQVQAQSGINASIEKPGTAVYGSPALAYRDFLRSYAYFKKLPDLARRLKSVEQDLKNSSDA